MKSEKQEVKLWIRQIVEMHIYGNSLFDEIVRDYLGIELITNIHNIIEYLIYEYDSNIHLFTYLFIFCSGEED